MTARRKVLVTGAAGFIGRHLATALVAQGHEVVAHVRSRDLPASLADSRLVTITRATETHPLPTANDLADVDVVCHVAAFVPEKFSDSHAADSCLRINALDTLRLAESACVARVRRFIHFSSGQIYRYSSTPVAEDAPTFPAARATYYLGSKLLAELYVEHLRLEHGLPATIWRVGSCYGPGMKGGVVGHFIELARRGETIEIHSPATADFVHVDDVVNLTLTAIDATPPTPAMPDPNGETCGPFNVGSGQPRTLHDLAAAVKAAFPDRLVPIVDRTEAAPKAALPAFAPLAIERAQRVWGYRPRSLEAGIAQTCEERIAHP